MATLAHYVIQFTKGQPDSVEEAIKDREQLRLDFEMLFEVTDWILITFLCPLFSSLLFHNYPNYHTASLVNQWCFSK